MNSIKSNNIVASVTNKELQNKTRQKSFLCRSDQLRDKGYSTLVPIWPESKSCYLLDWSKLAPEALRLDLIENTNSEGILTYQRRRKNEITGLPALEDATIYLGHCGTGIRCGDEGLLALDFDFGDTKSSAIALLIVEEHLDRLDNPGTLIVRQGKAPKFLIPVRVPLDQVRRKGVVTFSHGDTNKDDQVLEFIGKGGYFVAIGDYPGSNERYKYLTADNVLNTSLEELPLVSWQWLSTLIGEIEKALKLHGYSRKDSGSLRNRSPAPDSTNEAIDSDPDDPFGERTGFERISIAELEGIYDGEDFTNMHYNELGERCCEIAHSVGRDQQYRDFVFNKAFEEGSHNGDQIELRKRIDGWFDRSEDYDGDRRTLASAIQRKNDRNKIEASLEVRVAIVRRIESAETEQGLSPIKTYCKSKDMDSMDRGFVVDAVQEWYATHKGSNPSDKVIRESWFSISTSANDNILALRDLVTTDATVYRDQLTNVRLFCDGFDGRIDSDEFEGYVRRTVEKKLKRSVKGQDMKELINSLHAVVPDTEKTRVERRYARIEEDSAWVIYMDTGWANREVIRVSCAGWAVIEASQCPVRFTRSLSFDGLPAVDQRTPRAQFSTFMARNAPGVPEKYVSLIKAWILNGMRSAKNFPVLVLLGEPGCAKTNALISLRSLLDPQSTGIRTNYPTDFDLFADRTHAKFIDDAAFTQDKFLLKMINGCSTGGTEDRRVLNTTARASYYDLTGPLAVSANEMPFATTDTLDRCLTVHCQKIKLKPGDRELTVDDIEQQLQADLPGAFAQLLDDLSTGLKLMNRYTVQQSDVRFKDLLRIGTIMHDIDWDERNFVDLYERTTAGTRANSLDGLPALLSLIEIAHWGAEQNLPPLSDGIGVWLACLRRWHEERNGRIENRTGNGWPLTGAQLKEQIISNRQALRDASIRMVPETQNPKKRRWTLSLINATRNNVRLMSLRKARIHCFQSTDIEDTFDADVEALILGEPSESKPQIH